MKRLILGILFLLLIASPLAAQSIAYTYGTPKLGASYTSSYVYPRDSGGALAANTVNDEYLALNRWTVEPGARSITGLSYSCAWTKTADLVARYFVIWKVDGTDLVQVATSADLGPNDSATTVHEDFAFDPAIVVTIEAGVEYYYGIRVTLETAGETEPHLFKSPTGAAFDSYGVIVKAAHPWATTIPLAASGTHNVATHDFLYCMQIQYTSPNYLEMDEASPGAGSYYVPTSTAEVPLVKLEEVIVADGEALTVAENNQADGAWTTINTTELDCGDTVGSQNDIISNANTINLPDIDGDGQEAEEFDLLFVKSDSTHADVFYGCRGLEPNMRSHACGAGAARDATYALTTSRVFTLAGTFTAEAIQAGCKPLFMLGDSQTYTHPLTGYIYPISYRWGGLADELERIYVIAGISGGKVELIRDNYFENSTPGDGDLIELLGIGGFWIVTGSGINDILGAGPTTLAQSWAAVQEITDDASYMLTEADDAGDDIAIIGLPPYSGAGADVYEATAGRWLSLAYADLATSLTCVYYNPWPDFVVSGTETASIPDFIEAYTADSGTHYNSTGGPIAQAAFLVAWNASSIVNDDAWASATTRPAQTLYFVGDDTSTDSADADNWAWQSGGVPSQHGYPGETFTTDVTNFSAGGVGDLTLNAGWTAAIVGMTGYTGTIDFAGEAVDLGTVGLDGTGGASASLDLGGSAITTTGDFDIGAVGTITGSGSVVLTIDGTGDQTIDDGSATSIDLLISKASGDAILSSFNGTLRGNCGTGAVSLDGADDVELSGYIYDWGGDENIEEGTYSGALTTSPFAVNPRGGSVMARPNQEQTRDYYAPNQRSHFQLDGPRSYSHERRSWRRRR